MRRQISFVVSMTLIVVVSRALEAQASPVFGLRLSSLTSMQWSADTLMLSSEGDTYQLLPVRQIEDVWMGPMKGAFIVVSDRGLGMLVGPSLGPSAFPFDERAVLRSSRPEAVYALLDAVDGAPRRRFVEWRSKSRQRDVIVAPAEVIDFDVDIPGRIVMLTRDRRLYAADGKALTEFVIGGPGAPADGEALLRVFVDAGGGEITVLTSRIVYRLNTATNTWTNLPFDPAVDALVRHAVSRRMRVESRFLPGNR